MEATLTLCTIAFLTGFLFGPVTHIAFGLGHFAVGDADGKSGPVFAHFLGAVLVLAAGIGMIYVPLWMASLLPLGGRYQLYGLVFVVGALVYKFLAARRSV